MPIGEPDDGCMIWKHAFGVGTLLSSLCANLGFQRPIIEFDFHNQSKMPIYEAEQQDHSKKPDDWFQRPQSEINSQSTMFKREAEQRDHLKKPNDGFQRPQTEINSQSTMLNNESEQRDDLKKPYDLESQTKPVSPEKMEEMSCKNRSDCIRANMSTPRTEFHEEVVTADGGRPHRPANWNSVAFIDSLLGLDGLIAPQLDELKIPDGDFHAIQKSIKEYETTVLHKDDLTYHRLEKSDDVSGDSVDTGEFEHYVFPKYRPQAPRPKVDLLKVLEELSKIECPDRENLPPFACTLCGKDEENHWFGNCPLNPVKIPLHCDVCEKDGHVDSICRYKNFLPVDAKVADDVFLHCDWCSKMGRNVVAFRNRHRDCHVRVF